MKVRIEKHFRGLKEGDEYIFPFKEGISDYICIVGENGCGKSSLMNAIVGKYTKNKVSFSNSIVESNRIKLSENISIIESEFEVAFGFDASKEGAATIDTSFDASSYIQNGGFYADRKSHGEGQLIYLSNFLSKIEKEIIPNKTLICLDEFDKGFSLKNQLRAKNIIGRFVHQFACQVIYSTHNPFLIIDSVMVFDFEKREYEVAEQYLKNQTGFLIKRAKIKKK